MKQRSNNRFLGLLAGFFFLTCNYCEAGRENIFKKHEFVGVPLQEIVREIAVDRKLNFIVGGKAGSNLVNIKFEDDEISRIMADIAEKGNAGFLEDNGILVFASKSGMAEFQSFPFLEGISNPASISLDFSDVDIRDLCTLIGKKSGFNIITEKSVRGNLTLRLIDVPWPTALHHAAGVLGVECRAHGNTIFVADKRRVGQLVPPTVTGEAKEKKISVQFRDSDIRDIFGIIARHFSRDFITGRNVRGNVTISLLEVCESEAAHILSASNGFACKKIENVWILSDPRVLDEVDKTLTLPKPANGDQPSSIDFRDCEVRSILDLIAKKGELKIGVSPGVSGNITLRFIERSPLDILRFIAGSQGWGLKVDGKTILISAPGEESIAPEFNLIKN